MLKGIRSFIRRNVFKRQSQYDSGINSPYWQPWIAPNYSISSIGIRRLAAIGIIGLALNIYSGALIRFPLRVKNKRGENLDHPALAIIERPNSWMRKSDMMLQLAENCLLGGNFVAKVEWDSQTGALKQILPFLSGSVWAYPRLKAIDFTDPIALSGPRAWFYRDFKGRVWWPEGGAGYSILHIRDFCNSADFLMGIARLTRARIASETSMNIADSILGAAARGFLNPAIISGSLAQSGSEEAKQKAEEAIKAFYNSGAARKGSALLLPGDLKVEKLAMDMRQADLAFCKKTSDQELARIMGIQWVTSESLNVQSGAKEAARSLQAVTLKPWLEHCAQGFSAFLLSERERAAGLKFCFETEVMQSMDGRERGTYLSLLTKAGLISQNEGREMLGLPRLASPGMDIPQVEKLAEAEIKKPEGPDDE